MNHQFMWSYFKYKEVPYNLRWGSVLFIPSARSTIYGSNSFEFMVLVHFLGPLFWNKLPNLIKSSSLISEFKIRILLRKPEILTVGDGMFFSCHLRISDGIHTLYQEHTVKYTVQISTQNTAQSFDQFDQIVECSFTN